MKKLLAAAVLVVAMLFTVPAFADGPIVTPAWQVSWTYDATGLTVLGFRVYVQNGPGVVPDGTSFVAEVGPTVSSWVITTANGQKHVVVTAVLDVGETGPSNEEPFVMAPVPAVTIEPVP